jgi:hypothetical protein
VVILLGIIGWRMSAFWNDPDVLPPDDFVEYWAAGKLNLHGENPYDPELLYPLERFGANRKDMDEFGPTPRERAVMMWNPPWTLTIAMPLGMLPARLGQLVWMLINFGIVGGCAFLLWRLYGGRSNHWWLALALSFVYMPTVYCISSGQISGWILLGATLFLYFEQKNWCYLAGAAGVLMAIKPHLVYLFWPVLLGYSFFHPRGWKIIAGGVGTGIVFTLIPLALNSQVLHQYLDAMGNRPPEQFKSPTLGTLLRIPFEEPTESIYTPLQRNFKLQFVTNLLGLLWLCYFAARQKSLNWNWRDKLPLVLLVSFVTAAYGAWPYDLLILLSAVIEIAAGVDRNSSRRNIFLSAGLFIAITLTMALMSAFKAYSFWFFWAGPTILTAYLLLRRIISSSAPVSSQID